MPEPERLESLAPPDADRDSRAELLLVDGLDQYFAGNYENAIHIWTRVLFLDRTHTRARAYIDRARTALAERQRRTDELLETSYRLAEDGQTGAARSLLNEVVAERGDDERASALRARLERLEQFERIAATPSRLTATTPSARPLRPATQPVGRRRVSWRAAILLASLILILVAFAGSDVPALLGLRSADPDLIVARPPAVSAPLSTSDIALIRARNAFARGQLAEALRTLDRVAADSPAHAEAEALRIRIQQSLIASTTSRTEARRP